MEPVEARRAGTERTVIQAGTEIAPDLAGQVEVHDPETLPKSGVLLRLGHAHWKGLAGFCHGRIIAFLAPTGGNFFYW